ncbi:MAG: glycosyltransferase family 2 protein, partial [Acidisphaera sp.]|nr:glycosyltransferase family 2 protein [Acidisphaera sp.]
AAVEALGRLLPDDELRWLGARILSSAIAIDRLARLLPRDVWAQTAVPALAEWTQNRDAARPRAYVLPREFDHLSLPTLASQSVTFGHAVAAAARAEVMPRKMMCIMAAARNEGIYLLDWIAYHRSIGVEHFFIYSNNNDDGSDDLLALLAEHGEITWIDNHVDAGVRPQLKGYGHALSIMPEILDYRWTLCIDIDEFFGFDTKRFGSLQDYVNWQEADHVDAIALSWLMFGSNAESRWRDEPIWERMTRRELKPHIAVKSLFRTNRFRHSWCHFPVPPPGFPPITFLDSAGDLHCAPGQNRDQNMSLSPRADVAWISHYYARSAEEFLWKKARNTGDQPTTHLGVTLIEPSDAESFVEQHRNVELTSDRRMHFCAKRAAAEKARLLGLPGVGACNAGLKSNFQKISAEILGHLQAASQGDKALETFAALFGS